MKHKRKKISVVYVNPYKKYPIFSSHVKIYFQAARRLGPSNNIQINKSKKKKKNQLNTFSLLFLLSFVFSWRIISVIFNAIKIRFLIINIEIRTKQTEIYIYIFFFNLIFQFNSKTDMHALQKWAQLISRGTFIGNVGVHNLHLFIAVPFPEYC